MWTSTRPWRWCATRTLGPSSPSATQAPSHAQGRGDAHPRQTPKYLLTQADRRKHYRITLNTTRIPQTVPRHATGSQKTRNTATNTPNMHRGNVHSDFLLQSFLRSKVLETIRTSMDPHLQVRPRRYIPKAHAVERPRKRKVPFPLKFAVHEYNAVQSNPEHLRKTPCDSGATSPRAAAFRELTLFSTSFQGRRRQAHRAGKRGWAGCRLGLSACRTSGRGALDPGR